MQTAQPTHWSAFILKVLSFVFIIAGQPIFIHSNILSPIVAVGDADIIIAFEKLEALRWRHYLKKDGTLPHCFASSKAAIEKGYNAK